MIYKSKSDDLHVGIPRMKWDDLWYCWQLGFQHRDSSISDEMGRSLVLLAVHVKSKWDDLHVGIPTSR